MESEKFVYVPICTSGNITFQTFQMAASRIVPVEIFLRHPSLVNEKNFYFGVLSSSALSEMKFWVLPISFSRSRMHRF